MTLTRVVLSSQTALRRKGVGVAVADWGAVGAVGMFLDVQARPKRTKPPKTKNTLACFFNVI